MGDVLLRAPAALTAMIGLADDAKLRDLGADLWERLESDAMALLAAQVARIVQAGLTARRFDRARDRIFEGGVPLELLRLGPRARNVLLYRGLVHDGMVGSVELRDLVRARNVGGTTILQLLAAAEEVQSTTQTSNRASAKTRPGSSAAERTPRSLSRAVKREAEKLMRKRWAQRIRRGDARLGSDVSALLPGAITPFAAAKLLPYATYDPAEARTKAGMIRRFMSRVDRMGRLTLETELDEILGAITPREHQRVALRRRFGWDGSRPGTLEDAANAIGVTRERVRQLERKFQRAIGQTWTPALDRALRIVTEMQFSSLSDIQSALREAGLIDRDFPVASLLGAAQLFGREVPKLVEYGDMLAPADFASVLAKVEQRARRLTDHWGTTTVAELSSVLIEDGVTLDEELARKALSQVRDVRFLDSDRNWFWLGPSRRNRLLNNVRKIMSVAGSIAVGELRDGVGRTHRARGFRPPRSVLARICEDSGDYVVSEGRVIGKPGLPDWRGVLAENERLIVETLFAHGPVMRRADLEEVLVRDAGMNRNSFYIYLTYSPILERYAAGVFGLRGATITAAEISAMIPPVIRSQVLRDHGWTPERKVWIVYRLSAAAIATGVLTVPAALTGVVRGQYALVTDDGDPVGTLMIEESRLWGLSAFYRRRGVEVGDYILLTFDVTKRRSQIEVGAADVGLRYEDDNYPAPK